MSRRAAGIVLALALALIVAGLAWWLLAERGEERGGEAGGEEASGPEQGVLFSLYFPADGGGLRGEPRELQVTEAPRNRVRKIALAVLAGPKAQGLYRPFPPEVKLGAATLADGVAYLDLVSNSHPEPPSSGSTEEMQRIFSLVNSVALNVPEAERVVLLWNGLQRVSFGHLDTSEPLRPDRRLVGR